MLNKAAVIVAIFSLSVFSENIKSPKKCNEFIVSYANSISPDYQSLGNEIQLRFSMLQTYGEARDNEIEQEKGPEYIAKKSKMITDSIASYQVQISRIELGCKNIATITDKYDSLSKKLDDSCALMYNKAKVRLFFTLLSVNANTYRDNLDFIKGVIQANDKYLDRIKNYIN